MKTEEVLQPAVLSVSSIGTPAALVAYVAALLVLWGLNMSTFIPAAFIILFTQRDIVFFVVGPWGLA